MHICQHVHQCFVFILCDYLINIEKLVDLAFHCQQLYICLQEMECYLLDNNGFIVLSEDFENVRQSTLF